MYVCVYKSEPGIWSVRQFWRLKIRHMNNRSVESLNCLPVIYCALCIQNTLGKWKVYLINQTKSERGKWAITILNGNVDTNYMIFKVVYFSTLFRHLKKLCCIDSRGYQYFNIRAITMLIGHCVTFACKCFRRRHGNHNCTHVIVGIIYCTAEFSSAMHAYLFLIEYVNSDIFCHRCLCFLLISVILIDLANTKVVGTFYANSVKNIIYY